MPSITYIDGNVRTFVIETPGQLDGKVDYLVELGTAPESVKLLATATNAFGAVRNLRQPGRGSVAVRLLGGGGTLRLVQSGPIARGGLVKAVAGGTVAAATTTGDRVVGRKISNGPGQAGEVIEVLDVIEKI